MKKNLKFIKLIGIFLILLTACNEDRIGENDYGGITGKVVASGTNIPLENVRIATNPVSSTVFTDAEGNFVIENVPAGDYSVVARLDGYLADFEPASVVPNANSNVIFELQISTANNKPPTTPELLAPAENEVLESVEVVFKWKSTDPDNDPIIYSLELRNDINTDVLIFDNITEPTFTYSELLIGAQYFWQVTASDNINDPVLSPIGTFSVSYGPASNRFLFVRNIDGNNVIFSADEEGNEFQLTSENNNSYRPRRNVAAGRIAYLQTTGAQVDIYTMKRDGTDKVKVTSTIKPNGFNLNEINIAWPATSDYIYFPYLDKLYRIRSNGQGLQKVYVTPDGSLISEVAVSENASIIALKTNDLDGYNIAIFTINFNGTVLDTLISGVYGAAGGLDISVTNQKVVYTYDVSEFQSSDYRRLDSRIFLFDIPSGITTDISNEKPNGTNDLDSRFAPNEAFVIFTNTSNDGISRPDVYKLEIGEDESREELYQNAFMPDWE